MDPDADPYWIQIRIGIQPKMLDPDPDEMNADPKKYIFFHVKLQLFVTFNSDQDPNPNLHWFGFLNPDLDPH